MNTKSIIGIIIAVIIIVLIAVWLVKAPASPVEPKVTTVPVTTPTNPSTKITTPDATPSNASGQATTTTFTTNKPISSKTINNMKIDIIKEGTGPAITNGQTAVMLYTGKLTDGSVFDSTDKHGNQPFSFALGSGMVIKGWDQGILGMKVGEQRTLTIPPELGYGAAGYPPVIPQNATLVFDVTLVGIK
jgi:FKBP-type peptidyl-prolyl cis-trans isomerase FkpA